MAPRLEPLRTAHLVVSLVACLALIGVTSCDRPMGPTAVSSVAVDPESATVTVGASVQLKATLKDVLDRDLLDRSVSWSSSDPEVATVDAAGVVKGVSVGEARITATSEGVRDRADVEVTAIPVAQVAVHPPAAFLAVGSTVRLEAVPEDPEGNALTNRQVTWASSDLAVATVNDSGLVTGRVVGVTTITATCEDVEATVGVVVTDAPAASVTVQPVSATVAVDASFALTATVRDSMGNVLSGRPVVWSSSDEAVAVVGSSGRVVGRAVGSATITATSDGVRGTATVTVTQAVVASVAVSPPSAEVVVGDIALFVATPKDAAGNPLTGRVVIWSSGNTAVATVDPNGLVTGRAAGDATITATCEGVVGAGAITVRAVPVASVDVSPASAEVVVGASVRLTATPEDAAGNPLAGRAVTWTSGNPAVATVDPSGLVTGHAVGDAMITATCEGVDGAGAIAVRAVPVGSVDVSPASAEVVVGASVQLTATPKDVAGNPMPGRVVTWSSDNSKVATVDGGLVTSHAVGTATITATSEGEAGTATITVRPVPVASVDVSPPAVTVPAGRSVQLTATPKDAAGTPLSGRVVTWSSSDGSVASVSPGGLVSGKGVGVATITATVEGASGSATATVLPPPLVASVAVSPPSATILVGAQSQFEATPRDAKGNALPGRPVSWSSSNTAVATVSSSGLVTGRASGSATIAATSEGVSGTAVVTVQPQPVPVASVAVTPSATIAVVGRSVPLTATPRDAAGNPLSGRSVTWSSNNAAVATVDASGIVTCRSAGMARIFATCEGVSGTATVTVLPPVASVEVTPPSASVIAGRTVQLTATPRDAAGNPLSGLSVTWSSDNAAVASVSASGLVTAHAPGNASVSATCEGVNGAVAVTVTPVPVALVTVAPASAQVIVGASVRLTATPRDAAGNPLTGRAVTWSSASPAVATVDAKGFVTGQTVGEATITATCEGIDGAGAITVRPVPVGSVDVSPTSAEVIVGASVRLTATPKDAAGNPLPGRVVTWSSGNPPVATVNGGLVTSHAAGTATITATSEGRNGTAAITVRPVPVASVAVSPPATAVNVGESVQLAATPRDSEGSPLSGRVVTWSSNNTAAATVSAGGLVSGRGVGVATITATVEGVNGSATVTVTPPPPVASLAVSPPSALVSVSGTVQFVATPRDSKGDPLHGRVIVWSSSNEFVATVSASGLAIGQGVGGATITASCEGKSASARIEVQQILGASSLAPAPSAPPAGTRRTAKP